MKKLKDEEEITICQNHMTVRVRELKFIKELSRDRKKTHTQRIHENLPLYLRDLDRRGMENPIISNPIIGNNWVEKFAYLCNILKDERFNKRTNSESLELYFQIGELLAEKGWNDSAKNELNLYFTSSRGKLISRIAKRVLLLFNTYSQNAIQVVQDLNISVLSHMSEKDFNEVLLVEAKQLKEKEIASRDSQELILQRGM
ncbi:1498_t:CDS:1, partial [Racocetra fulgida]